MRAAANSIACRTSAGQVRGGRGALDDLLGADPHRRLGQLDPVEFPGIPQERRGPLGPHGRQHVADDRVHLFGRVAALGHEGGKGGAEPWVVEAETSHGALS